MILDTNIGNNKAARGLATSAGFLRTRRRGFIILELIIAVIVISFIIRPVIVQHTAADGTITYNLDWQVPMGQLLGHLSDLGGFIDRSWAGLDAQFGHTGGFGDRPTRLMQAQLSHGVTLMTAGIVGSDGRVAGDLSQLAPNFEAASKGITLAYYHAAVEGMAQAGR